MNAVTQLESMGLSLRLDQDECFILGGLRKLPPDSQRHAVEMARAHKPAILEELKKRAGTVPGSTVPDYAAFCPDYWQGCQTCPEYRTDSVRFCGRYNRLRAETPEVLQ